MIVFFLLIVKLKKILRKLLSPTDLTTAQFFSSNESLKVVTFSEEKDFVFTAFGVIMCVFEELDDGMKLYIVGLVTYLSADHYL